MTGWNGYQDQMRAVEDLRRAARTATRRGSAAERRVEELEQSLGRVALLARTLAELCLEKGLITSDELDAKLAEVDFADGAQIGTLDPDVVLPGEQKLADLESREVTRKPRPRGGN